MLYSFWKQQKKTAGEKRNYQQPQRETERHTQQNNYRFTGVYNRPAERQPRADFAGFAGCRATPKADILRKAVAVRIAETSKHAYKFGWRQWRNNKVGTTPIIRQSTQPITNSYTLYLKKNMAKIDIFDTKSSKK